MVDFFLFLASYLNLDMIKEVDNPFYYYEDNLIAICIVSLCIGFMIRYQRKVLESQNGKIEQTLAQIRQEKRRTEKISPELANMQDLLIYVTKGLSEVTTRLRKEGKKIDKELNHFITLNLFTTITNANFDNEVFYSRVKETLRNKRECN